MHTHHKRAGWIYTSQYTVKREGMVPAASQLEKGIRVNTSGLTRRESHSLQGQEGDDITTTLLERRYDAVLSQLRE